MYHVSAQGVDERMINVHYYFIVCSSSSSSSITTDNTNDNSTAMTITRTMESRTVVFRQLPELYHLYQKFSTAATAASLIAPGGGGDNDNIR